MQVLYAAASSMSTFLAMPPVTSEKRLRRTRMLTPRQKHILHMRPLAARRSAGASLLPPCMRPCPCSDRIASSSSVLEAETTLSHATSCRPYDPCVDALIAAPVARRCAPTDRSVSSLRTCALTLLDSRPRTRARPDRRRGLPSVRGSFLASLTSPTPTVASTTGAQDLRIWRPQRAFGMPSRHPALPRERGRTTYAVAR